MTEKTALVTGGTGFVGFHVAKSLVDAGIRVRALVRSRSREAAVRRLQVLGATVEVGDLLYAGSYRPILREVDYLFHCAAVHKIWTEDPKGLYRVNVDGTRMLLEEAARAGIEQFIYTSSVKTIGVPPGDSISDEETPYNLWDRDGDYGRSKYLAEKLILEYPGDRIRIKLLNPAAVIGPDDHSGTPTMELLRNFFEGRYRVCLETRLGLVDVRDVGRAHLLAITRGQPRKRYILCAGNLSLKELFQRVDCLAGGKRSSRMIPYALAYPIAWACQGFAAISHRPPVVTCRSLRIASLKPGYDGRRASREFNFRYRDLNETLTDAIDWISRRHAAHVEES